MKSLLLHLSIASMLVLVGCSSQTETQEPPAMLDQLLEKNVAARGGRDRFEALLGMRLKVHIEEPTFEVTGTYAATREGYVRVDIYAGGHRAFSEALGPVGGWQWHGGEMETIPLTSAGESALRRGMVGNLYPLYAWPGNGYRLRLLDDVPSEDGFYTIFAEEPDGFTKTLFMDASSYLVTRQAEFSALHPDVDSTEQRQISRVLDWLVVNGISLPVLTERVEESSGEVIQRATVLSAELVSEGEEEPDWMQGSYFKPPDFG